MEGLEPLPALLDAAPADGEAAPGIASVVGLTPAEINERHRRLALQWLLGDPLPELLISRSVFVPLQQMQRRMVWIGSRAWERQQQAAEAKAGGVPSSQFSRSYPALELAEGFIEDKCLHTVWKLFTVPVLWALMPMSSVTVKNVGLAFRMLSRAGALVYTELVILHEAYPWRLFLLVKHPHMAAQFKKEIESASCMLDAWTAEFVHDHDLEDPDTRMILFVIVILLHTDMSEIECRHAWIRRLLVRLQAKKMLFEDLAASWVGLQTRKRQMDAAVFENTSGNVAETENGEKEGDAEPVVRLGPWRAFVAKMTSGSKGRPDLSEVALRYRNLDEDERAECQRLAAAAYRSGDGFGARPRDVLENRRRRSEDVVAARMPFTSAAPDEDLHIAPDMATSEQGLDAMLKRARLECRVKRQKNKNAEEEEKTTIANFVAEKGAHIANDWFGDSSIGTLKVTPSSFCSVFRFAPDVGEASAVFNMFGQSCQATTNLPKAVEAWWEGLHKLIKHDECRPVYEAAVPHRLCHEARICLCSEDGRRLRRFGDKVIAGVKEETLRGTDGRKDLVASNLVLRLEARSADHVVGTFPLEAHMWHIAHTHP